MTWDVQQCDSLQAQDDAPLLYLRWVERNGPQVTAPERRGFETMLIERGLKQDMSAKVSLEFARTGVVAPLRYKLTSHRLLAGE